MTKSQRVRLILQISLLHLLAHIHTSSGIPAFPQQRLSTADWTDYNSFEPTGRGTYAFGYDIEDPETDNVQYRDEERFENGTVVGSYGYVKPDGSAHIVRYIADKNGYRATVEDTVGQPRFYGYPAKTNLVQNTPSPILLAAMESQKSYGNQQIHDQRLRPIDSIPNNNRFNSFSKTNDAKESQDEYLRQHYSINPMKYYMRY